MDIIKEINENWDSETGCRFKIRKGNIIRELQVYNNCKWDVWLWGSSMSRQLLGRGLVKGDYVSKGFYVEAGTREVGSIVEYLKDFRIVKERSK